MKRLLASPFFGFILIIASCNQSDPINNFQNEQKRILSAPPLGWNSYDSYFASINEQIIIDNINAFEQRLKPSGYEYFVLDDGWQCHWDLEKNKYYGYIDSFGRCMADTTRFAQGLKPYIELAHSKGIKFGVWLIRGAPIEAKAKGLKIKGTSTYFTDVLDESVAIDPWLGVPSWHGTSAFKDLNAMQAYYNSVFELLADWNIDFVKYDYVINSPKDISAIAEARKNHAPNIVLSLSAGCGSNTQYFDIYSRADMVRITSDVWDNRKSLVECFKQWELLSSYAQPGFYLDLDMIPFGSLPVYGRNDSLTLDQKQSFIAQRALAASPLIMGGSLTESDSTSFALITDSDMLECNQNGVCGKLINRTAKYDIWKTKSAENADNGWVGVFNRTTEQITINLSAADLDLDKDSSYKYYDIWKKHSLPEGSIIDRLNADGVLFLSYKKQ